MLSIYNKYEDAWSCDGGESVGGGGGRWGHPSLSQFPINQKEKKKKKRKSPSYVEMACMFLPCTAALNNI